MSDKIASSDITMAELMIVRRAPQLYTFRIAAIWQEIVAGRSRTPGPSLISWQRNLITDKDNNRIMFGNQNNYQIQNSAIFMYHKDKLILEFDYFLQRKSENICVFWRSQINNYRI